MCRLNLIRRSLLGETFHIAIKQMSLNLIPADFATRQIIFSGGGVGKIFLAKSFIDRRNNFRHVSAENFFRLQKNHQLFGIFGEERKVDNVEIKFLIDFGERLVNFVLGNDSRRKFQ